MEQEEEKVEQMEHVEYKVDNIEVQREEILKEVIKLEESLKREEILKKVMKLEESLKEVINKEHPVENYLLEEEVEEVKHGEEKEDCE